MIIFIEKILPSSFLDGPQPYTVFELFFQQTTLKVLTPRVCAKDLDQDPGIET